MLDANSWVLIIAAIFLGISKIVSMCLDYLREQAKIKRDELAAKEVKEVKSSLSKTTVSVESKLDNVTEKIEEIHIATNSMKDALVKVTGESEKAKGKLEGAAEEREKRQTPG